jgi:hypothetical protein
VPRLCLACASPVPEKKLAMPAINFSIPLTLSSSFLAFLASTLREAACASMAVHYHLVYLRAVISIRNSSFLTSNKSGEVGNYAFQPRDNSRHAVVIYFVGGVCFGVVVGVAEWSGVCYHQRWIA